MQQPEYDRSRVGAYLGLGLTFALSALLFAWLGSLLDGRLGSSPAFTLLGAFIGAAAGFYNLVRSAMDLQKGEKSKKNETDGNTEPSKKARDIR
ncbi:MAG: AtpZ/AtpI family protein [Gemmatimonadales bacterium]|jgi:F0F1-type ATP synthase assembly protein I